MSSFRDPVGPLPPNVYWRRRLVVGIGLLALIVVVLMIIFRPSSADEGKDTAADGVADSQTADTSAADTQDPGTGTDSEPADGVNDPASDDGSDGASDGGSGDNAAEGDANTCDAGVVELKAVADGSAYAKGENPKLRLQITNTGGTDCSLNVGTSQQQFVITSGEEVIWNSAHCETDAKDSSQVLKAGQTLQTDELVWNRTKSSSEKCNTAPISAIADATYQFHVQVGDMSSEKVRLRILN